jgi:hypothetical protein
MFAFQDSADILSLLRQQLPKVACLEKDDIEHLEDMWIQDHEEAFEVMHRMPNADSYPSISDKVKLVDAFVVQMFLLLPDKLNICR